MRLAAAFRADTRGQIAIIFAFASAAIFVGLGASVDLATAFAARQRLSEVATLTCQYSTRPSVATTATATATGSNGFATYVTNVNSYAGQSLTQQNWNSNIPVTGSDGVAGHYFTATPATGGTTAAANTPSNPVVDLSAAVPTAFAKILNVNSIPVHAHINCENLAYTPQIVNPPEILHEGFEKPCTTGSYCQYTPTGGAISITPTQSFPPTPAYVGYNGFKWYVVGYCLETDYVGVINPTVPEGVYAAELDCGNSTAGQTAGNSSISSNLYLETGQYELRYNFRSRIDYPNYDPAYVCGSTAYDVSWANDTSGISPPTGQGVARTDQINVYLDQNIPGSNGSVGSAPLHTTLDGNQHLAGSNLIDECVHSNTWIERSVKVKVTTPGVYWLTFAADGQNDSYGGQVDNIRFCQEQCAGSLQDNFPASWKNAKLFEDTFEAGATANAANGIYTNGNPFNSKGTSGTAASGWPSQPATGWLAAPNNQMDYGTSGAAQGNNYITLDGVGGSSTNRIIARPFVLDPGYYQVTYNYVPTVNFYPYVTGTYCVVAPTGGAIYPATAGTYVSGAVKNGGVVVAAVDTNIEAAFMASSLLASTPNGSPTLNAATTYTNPDGTVTSTPTAAPDTVNFQNYVPTGRAALLDTCGFSVGWIARSVNIKITKPGLYWLSFSEQGSTADGYGGALDDITLIGLGSPYMSGAPTTALATVPVPSPQHDVLYAPATYAGFSIVAAPFTPPAADQ